MKAHLLIAALLTTLAHAKPFPPAPSLDALVAAAVKDRKVNAPYYAENPAVAANPSASDLAQPVERPVLERLVTAPVMMLPARPDTSTVGPVSLRSLAPIQPGSAPEVLAAARIMGLPGIQPMIFDPFTLKLQFIWKKPHGQWMNQLLKDITAAKAAGDTETYERLTKKYAAWAEKYLRRESPLTD